jgi:hypothetical protein
MDLSFSDRHLRLRAEVRRFVAEHGHLPLLVGGGRARSCRHQPTSSCNPSLRMTPRHLAISACTKAANCSGVP